MKRDDGSTSPIRTREFGVDRSMLRQHGEAAGVDRVWERLEPKLTLGRSTQPRAGRWPAVSMAVAAGFALGIAASGWLKPDTQPTQVVAPDQPSVERTTEVFAAGTTPRSYPLPGGGTLTLEPGSIVDTVSLDGQALTLRLVRGDAVLASPAGTGSIELMVGRAHVATGAGARFSVRRTGDHAFLEMFEGSAQVTAPNQDNEMVASQLGPNDARRVRIHISTASVPLHQRPHDMRPRAAEDVEDDTAPVEVLPETPAWVVACKVDKDDDRTLQLLQQDPEAFAAVTDPQVLACVANGQKFSGKADAAIATYEKLMLQSDALRAFQAAKSVQNLARKQLNLAKSDAERQQYELKLQQYAQQERQLALVAVAEGHDLTPFMGADGMCRRIVAEAGVAKPNWEAVASLGAQYKNAFPTGNCIATIHGILAKRPAAPDAEADPPPEDNGPYEDDPATDE